VRSAFFIYMINNVKDWRSTLAGLAVLATAAAGVHGAGDLVNPATLSQVLAGLGLILATFSKKTPALPPAV
jgi:hypothetical protein